MSYLQALQSCATTRVSERESAETKQGKYFSRNSTWKLTLSPSKGGTNNVNALLIELLLIVLKGSVLSSLLVMGECSGWKSKFIALCVDFLICIYIFSYCEPELSFAIKLTSFYYQPTFFATQCESEFSDPYEQKLFHLFSTHENGNGLIDLAGLNSLVQTLQLKERGSLLIDILLKKGTRQGVTFKEFREGLLQVITSASEEDGTQLTTVVVLVNFTLSLVTCTAGLSHLP